jgi:adenylylsulfate kinase
MEQLNIIFIFATPMANLPENIHPIFNTLLTRESKEKLLKQRAKVIWFTGLSGSGKSTIARGLENELHMRGYLTMILDGDNVRSGINSNLRFSEEDRKENIRRVAELAKILMESGVITLCCFVSPTEELRALAKNIIGAENLIEVFVNTSIEECEKRDVKGLYEKARRGEIKDFTGVNAPFEVPVNPDINLLTSGRSIYDTLQEVLKYVLPVVKYEERKKESWII